MGRIRVLDDNMINMIAAGEVIERPASVVKELLENSIDAGASRIVLKIEDGGRKLISVTDDGCGIEAEDLETAFMPHATSKIRGSDDLDGIVTMGFRGEALASIASVSKVNVVSRRLDSIQANQLEIDCGQKKPVRPCSGDYGTTIEVRNLFYKLPARRKFLRTANTEMGHINEHFTRIALAHCELDLTLINNGRQAQRLAGKQSVRDRIGQLMGKAVSEDLLETHAEEKGIRIRALLGKPVQARGSSKFQYVFLNGRYIRDKFISHAIKEAYRGLIEPNKHPVVFMFLEMDPHMYDVNVHPTKIEVRFQNSNMVHSQVLAVMREKLLSTNLDVEASLPGDKFRMGDEMQVDTEKEARRKRIAAAMENFFKDHKPTEQSQFRFPDSTQKNRSRPSGGAQRSYPASGGSNGHRASRFEMPERRLAEPMEPLEKEQTQADNIPTGNGQDFMQVHDSYLIVKTETGFDVIDQHALHERIIYERLRTKLNEGGLTAQKLLIPETFSVSDEQAKAVEKNADLIAKLGLEIESFGPGTMAIQAFPVILNKAEPVAFVQGLLDVLSDHENVTVDAEGIIHEILDMAACKAAVKAGQSLSPDEIRQLLKEKEQIERPSRCPHGRPTTIKFSLAQLEKQFKRTGF
ncbi:DNA mismatch repair protein MutL [Anaerohalosphaera lusitana]|uniref:DNA mismatch repair protein MutL n=1 Tax=Anaerohalosphaera lusitana TaxID=1936003 RepID=A0A1U9NP50_9BACT|nr:DNA mismatch repair endonuclease MutL [Anaerohalosphaera lusitana]AQT69722.1 DNA mismatch repair protein MutL [Anaerohalosphaera lusitana]